MRLDVATMAGAAVVELDRPRNARALLVLTHGSGGGIDSVDLLGVRDAAFATGIAVARVLQPYRLLGRRTPPKPALQDEAWISIVAGLRRRRGLRSLPLVVGGRSNGARVACRTAVTTGAVGVLALAFPLHPPGKPEGSRIAELDAAGVPVLVVQGERDPFGVPPAGVARQVMVVARADHSLRRDLDIVAVAVRNALDAWI